MSVDRVQVLKWENPATGGVEEDTYPTPIDPNEDYTEARGYLVQNDSSRDAITGVSRDSGNNLTFFDGVVSGTKTLTQLLSDITTYDFLLDNEPNSTDYDYAANYSGLKVSYETWTNHATSKLLKRIDYTYTLSKLTQEVRKIYGSDGITVVAQMTIVYSYTGLRLTSYAETRNI